MADEHLRNAVGALVDEKTGVRTEHGVIGPAITVDVDVDPEGVGRSVRESAVEGCGEGKVALTSGLEGCHTDLGKIEPGVVGGRYVTLVLLSPDEQRAVRITTGRVGQSNLRAGIPRGLSRGGDIRQRTWHQQVRDVQGALVGGECDMTGDLMEPRTVLPGTEGGRDVAGLDAQRDINLGRATLRNRDLTRGERDLSGQ